MTMERREFLQIASLATAASSLTLDGSVASAQDTDPDPTFLMMFGGLCLFAKDLGNEMGVGFVGELTGFPTHFPLLVVPGDQVESVQGIPNIGNADTAIFPLFNYLMTAVPIDGSTGQTMSAGTLAVDDHDVQNRRYPAEPHRLSSWSSLQWLPSAGRIQPGAGVTTGWIRSRSLVGRVAILDGRVRGAWPSPNRLEHPVVQFVETSSQAEQKHEAYVFTQWAMHTMTQQTDRYRLKFCPVPACGNQPVATIDLRRRTRRRVMALAINVPLDGRPGTLGQHFHLFHADLIRHPDATRVRIDPTVEKVDINPNVPPNSLEADVAFLQSGLFDDKKPEATFVSPFRLPAPRGGQVKPEVVLSPRIIVKVLNDGSAACPPFGDP